MPLSVHDLMDAADVTWSGCVPWGTPPVLNAPGVYVVALSADPADRRAPVSFTADTAAVTSWLWTAPDVRVDGAPATAETLLSRIAQWWVADEPVQYVGSASRSVRHRVVQYYRTPIGAARPHSGGWFLKSYAGLEGLAVHYAPATDVLAAESAMLARFADGSAPPRLPFANLEWPRGRRKRHGISGARARTDP